MQEDEVMLIIVMQIPNHPHYLQFISRDHITLRIILRERYRVRKVPLLVHLSIEMRENETGI